MKKWIAIVLCTVLLCGCGATEAGSETISTENVSTESVTESVATETATESQVADVEALSDGKSLKVLAIGNSFSNNTTAYLYEIAKAQGMTDVIIGRLYNGGCSLEEHMSYVNTDEKAYTYYKKTRTGTWDQTADATLLQGLQDEEWDIITMQQNSANSGKPATYEPYLGQLIEYVNANKTNPDAKYVWNMTWAYQGDHKSLAKLDNGQETMYQSIVDTNQEVIVPNEAFVTVIPVGTAIQNARTSFLGDTLTKDGSHLNQLGEVIGGYTWYATFVGKPLDEIKLNKIPGGAEFTEDVKAVILESVNNALANPFEVTPSAITAGSQDEADDSSAILFSDCKDEAMADVTLGGDNATGKYYYFEKTGRTTYVLDPKSFIMQEVPATATKIELDLTYLNAKGQMLVYLNSVENQVYVNADKYDSGVDVLITMEKADGSWEITHSLNAEVVQASGTVTAGDKDVLYIGNGADTAEVYIDRIKIKVTE